METLAEHRRVEKLIAPIRKYCPHEPYEKQRLFLGLTCKEALYGGAAGGGKSDALLMGALQYVHVPGYSALILRTNLTKLELPGGLIPRSHEWLNGKADWNGGKRQWTFPSGATIKFGYLASALDKYNYGSSEFQYIAFEELTEFPQEDYLFLFSRIRMTEEIRARGVIERMRGATNPGGKGHEWTKARFVGLDAEEDLKNNTLKGLYVKNPPETEETEGVSEGPVYFVPAKIADNPAINKKAYEKNLAKLNPVARERLMNGDWTILPTGLFRPEWLRYFRFRGDSFICELLASYKDANGSVLHTNEIVHEFDIREAYRFVTIDTAGGVEDIEKAHKGKQLSYTAMGVWDHKRFGESSALLLRRVYRGKGLNYGEIRAMTREVYSTWKPSKLLVEDKALGPALQNDLRTEMPIQTTGTRGEDKVQRAVAWLKKAEAGQFYLPQGNNSWKHAYESEILSWQGLKDETNDQVDISSYAGIEVDQPFSGILKLDVNPTEVDAFRRESERVATKINRGWF